MLHKKGSMRAMTMTESRIDLSDRSIPNEELREFDAVIRFCGLYLSCLGSTLIYFAGGGDASKQVNLYPQPNQNH